MFVTIQGSTPLSHDRFTTNITDCVHFFVWTCLSSEGALRSTTATFLITNFHFRLNSVKDHLPRLSYGADIIVMLTSPPTMLVPVRETYLPSSRSGRAMRGNSIRYLVAAIGMLSHALPCVANHCSILEIKFVDYATASCEGTSASSCRTVSVSRLQITVRRICRGRIRRRLSLADAITDERFAFECIECYTVE